MNYRMNNLKEVLRKLVMHDMHVENIGDGRDLPMPTTHLHTHYIMKGDDVVHQGNLITIEYFALSLDNLETEDE